MAGASPRGAFTGSHMLNVRNARQRSEHDVVLLQNRLDRLKQEERKALKKIEETRRRADQIIHLKVRNQNNHLRKLEESEYLEEQRQRARERLQAERGKTSGAISAKAESVAEQKKRDAAEMRDLRSKIQNHISMQQKHHLEHARQVRGQGSQGGGGGSGRGQGTGDWPRGPGR